MQVKSCQKKDLFLKTALFFQCLISLQAGKLQLVLRLKVPSFSSQALDVVFNLGYKISHLSSFLCVTSHPSALAGS